VIDGVFLYHYYHNGMNQFKTRIVTLDRTCSKHWECEKGQTNKIMVVKPEVTGPFITRRTG